MDTPEKQPPSSTESSSESTSGDQMSLNPQSNTEIPPPPSPSPSNSKDTDSNSSDPKSPSPNDLPPSNPPKNAKPSTKNAKSSGKSGASGKPPKSEKPAKKPTNKSVSSYKSKLDDTVYQILFRTEFPALANAKKACLEDVVRYTKIHGKVERHLDSMEDKAIEGLQSEWKQRSDEFIAQEYPDLLHFSKPLQSSYTADVGMGTKATRPKRSNRKEDFRDLELDAEAEQKSSKRKRPESQANVKGKKKSKMASAKEPPNENEERELSKKEISEINRRERQYNSTLDGIWRDLVRKDIPKAHRLYVVGTSVKVSNGRKTATLAAKEAKKWQLKTNKQVKDFQIKGRRAMREMMSYWKRNEKEERDSKKKAEKVALDSARKQEEEREAMRQSRKLNFLITQTELYSHFVGSKTGQSTDEQSLKTDPNTLDFDAEDDSAIRAAAEANAQQAVAQARSKTSQFDEGKNLEDDGFQNPASLGDQVLGQPKLLSCTLKEYQLKGLTWLANLYEQGINGILADEMGLGKTVQSISVMAYLAEVHDIWGPFLVVAPASTLHNWQQEIAKFVPEFKVLPYWGSAKDRKVLRKFWDRKQLRYTKNSPFHVLVTSYQIIVADSQYFNRIKWQYMILDEAQAIKSSNSSRWKSLLNLQCRNRLLLTGTPIQNSMQELWALLHFIMPTLFDSHEEFSDWFSKDIESHATKNKELNEAQLKRLHMILKPFMLRRVKKHVQQELGDKIEIDVYCNLTPRQKMLYKLVKSQISIKDLIERGASGEDQASLMNLVMQFRKVCNHPDLFDRQEVLSAFSFAQFGNTSDWLREPPVMNVEVSAQNPIKFHLPKIFSSDSGLLDMPSMNSTNTVRESIYRKLSVITDPTNEYMTSISKFSGTPAGKIVEAAQQGLLERALDNDNYDLINDQASARSVSSLQIVNNSKTGTEYAGLESVYDDYLLNHYIKEQEQAYFARVTAPPISMYASEKFFFQTQQRINEVPFGLYPLTLNDEWNRYQKNLPMTPGRLPVVKDSGYTTISVPSMTKFIADSGKLKKLDELLVQLKKDDHRVLVYFQMTKMMDLMEEYLSYRQYKYLRLDGSSKLNDRRDLVNDWQTRPELFVFLLSTRAGGLGINLTAADTVVFFDSDWNPTIDSQAMDRAHRLGQTRQVTVYRLLVRGTIEERMRNRAKQKEQVQAVVMEGSKAAKRNAQESNINNDVAYWLLDDDNDGEPPSTN